LEENVKRYNGDQLQVAEGFLVAENMDTPIMEPGPEIPALVALIQDRYERCQQIRLFDEQRWLKAYRNFRGIYGPDTVWRSSEQSRVFVKITKTKVQAAYGQLIEVLFAEDKFPISVEPTTLPEGIPEYAHVDLNNPEAEDAAPESPYGYPGDGKEIAPGTTYKDLLNDNMKSVEAKYPKVPFKEGPAPDKTKMVQIEPALMAAKKMQKTIYDQLDGCNASTRLRHSLFEAVLLGTGIVKGPFSYQKTVHNWNEDPETGESTYSPSVKLVPEISSTSVWNFYPDPDAVSMEDASWTIERHKFSRSDMRALTSRPYFIEEAISRAIDQGYNYNRQWFEEQLDDNNAHGLTLDRYEVLEYWGVMDRETALDAGLELPSDFEDEDEVQINCWICGDIILRLVLNPFLPSRIPYYAIPYEINPYQFFGVGIPENMEDAQVVMNGHARMAIDNLAFAGNVILEIDENALVPGQDATLYPGKIFRRQLGGPGNAITSVKFQNTANENLAMFDKFRQLSDEATGIPSISHGQSGYQTGVRSAQQTSMLMGAAALNIKTVVKNLDDYLLQPLGEALFSWNMQFNEDIEIRGDLEVRARGTSSLMMKEVRSQRLMMFMNTAANPLMAPFVNWPTVLREIAIALDIDPDKFINSKEDAALFAYMMGQASGKGGEGGMSMPQQPQSPEGNMGAMMQGNGGVGNPGGAGGVGAATVPGGPGSTANTGESQGAI